MTYSQPVQIDPAAIYDDRSACLALCISGSALSKGRRDGSLRFVKRGHKTLYFGRWLIAWLEGSEAGAHESELTVASGGL
jgi:hypothetical protein